VAFRDSLGVIHHTGERFELHIRKAQQLHSYTFAVAVAITNQLTGTIINFHEAAIIVDFQTKIVIRSRLESESVLKRCLYLNPPTVGGGSVMDWLRHIVQIYIVMQISDYLANVAH